jgi:hypothetical protein
MQTMKETILSTAPQSKPGVVRMTCANPNCLNGGRSFLVPAAILAEGKFPPECRGMETPDYYVSPCLYAYCSRSCWADLCSD